jgi:hypothetical protein
VAQIIGPPACRDERGDAAVVEDDILLVAHCVCAAASQGTKGAFVPRGSVIERLPDLLTGDYIP